MNQYVFHLTAGYDFSFSYGWISAKYLINNTTWIALLPMIQYGMNQFRAKLKTIEFGLIGVALLFLLLPLLHRSMALFLYNHAFSLQSANVRSFFGSNNLTELSGGYFLSVIEMAFVVAVLVALDYQRTLANREKDLAKAELQALKMQLQPHFLFNTLHSISSMIDLDIKQAQRMITVVGDLFRTLLQRDARELITVAEEMDFVRNYLTLEHIRFQDRMHLQVSVESENALVPSMILQPIIENSVKHGVSKETESSHILIEIKEQHVEGLAPKLVLKVVNAGKSLQKHGYAIENGFGIGQKNVRRRLEQSYRGEFDCSFGPIDEHTYQSTITIPLQYDTVSDNR